MTLPSDHYRRKNEAEWRVVLDRVTPFKLQPVIALTHPVTPYGLPTAENDA